MKTLFVGILIIICLSTPALAEKTIVSEFDGTDWQGWTEIKKFNFLSGFLLGCSYVVKKNEPFLPKDTYAKPFDDMRKRLSGPGGGKKKKPAQNIFSKEDVIMWGHYRASMIQEGLADYAVYEITVNQLSKGMDELYREGKNSTIKIADALYVVKKQIRGASAAEIENILMSVRGD